MKGTLSIISDISLELSREELETMRERPLTGYLTVVDPQNRIPLPKRGCLLGVMKLIKTPYTILALPKGAGYEKVTDYSIMLHWDTWNEIRAQVRLREDAWKPVFVDRYTPLSSQFTIHVR